MIYIQKTNSKPDGTHEQAMKLLSEGLRLERDIHLVKEEIVYNAWGKPLLKYHKNDFFNISHCKNYIACVISHGEQVGIDIEEISDFSYITARKVCNQDELQSIEKSHDTNRTFYRLWTLKESYIKALGTGVSYPMKKANFNIVNRKEVRTKLQNCSFLLLENKNYTASVCYLKN